NRRPGGVGLWRSRPIWVWNNEEMMLPTKHTNTRERNFADKKSPNPLVSLVCFVGSLSLWDETNSQKATHLCRFQPSQLLRRSRLGGVDGSGAATKETEVSVDGRPKPSFSSLSSV